LAHMPMILSCTCRFLKQIFSLCPSCSRQLMAGSEEKAFKLKEELVNAKEALNKASLQQQVLSREKSELGRVMSAKLSS